MKGRLLIIVVAILVITMLSLAYYRPARDPDAVPSGKTGVVTIQTANPYSFDVRLEVKCDWEWQKGKYRFHQFITVPGKKQMLIRVPNSLKLCEIWPKVIW
jgi:hypothetical protein